MKRMMRQVRDQKSSQEKFEQVIFVDRDGVINEDPVSGYVTTWDAFRFIPGSIRALKKLTSSGFGVVIISNQAGIGDGAYPESALHEITQKMRDALKARGVDVLDVYYCLHGKNAGCTCRKPKTGLFKQAAKKIRFRAQDTYFIGDKATDVQAGRAFGLRTIYVLTGHGTRDQEKLKRIGEPHAVVPSIVEACDYVLRHIQS